MIASGVVKRDATAAETELARGVANSVTNNTVPNWFCYVVARW